MLGDLRQQFKFVLAPAPAEVIANSSKHKYLLLEPRGGISCHFRLRTIPSLVGLISNVLSISSRYLSLSLAVSSDGWIVCL